MIESENNEEVTPSPEVSAEMANAIGSTAVPRDQQDAVTNELPPIEVQAPRSWDLHKSGW